MSWTRQSSGTTNALRGASLTHAKLADKALGLLFNFNVALIKDGITRIVNGLKE